MPGDAPADGPGDADRHLAATAAALLDLGQVIDRVSRPLLVLAFAGLLARLALPVGWGALACLSGSALAGLAAAYAGARVAFDAALFRGLADGQGRLASLDGALTGLGLLPLGKAGRPLAPRIAGAQRLLRLQAGFLLPQVVLLAAAPVLGR